MWPDADGDPDERYWDALVSCECSAIRGDIAWSLDIYAQDAVANQPTERDLASAFASATRTAVLFPADETPPSAYWLATPEGAVTRARLLTSDDEQPVYTVDAVEAPVPQLPRAQVIRLPEAVREQRIGTPLADAFEANYPPDPTETTALTSGALRLSADWSVLALRDGAAFLGHRRDLDPNDPFFGYAELHARTVAATAGILTTRYGRLDLSALRGQPKRQ